MSSGGTGLNREQLRWLLSLSLSHAIKNARRDFSNGYLVAEILHCYYPQDVPLHSFDDKASSEKRKRDNWALLQKLFRRKGLRVSPDLVDGVLACRSGCIVPLLEKIHKHVTAPVPAAPAAPARMASPPRLARPAPSAIAPPEQYDVTSSPYSQGEMHASPEFVRYGSRGGFEMEARLMPAQRHQPNYGESHYDDINGSMRAPQMAGAIPAFHLNARAAPAAPAPFHDGYAHQGGGWTGAGGGLSPPAFHVQADPSNSYGMVHPTHSSVLAPPPSYGSGGADWGGGGGHPHAAPIAHDWMREGVVPPAFSSQVHDERRRPPPAYLVRPFAGNGPSVNAPYGQDPPAGYGQGAHEGAPHKAAFGIGKMESRERGGGGYANYGKENRSRSSYSDAHVQEQLERASQSAQSARNDGQYAGYGDKKRDAKYWTLGKLGADLDAKDLVDKVRRAPSHPLAPRA